MFLTELSGALAQSSLMSELAVLVCNGDYREIEASVHGLIEKDLLSSTMETLENVRAHLDGLVGNDRHGRSERWK
jgi:hypothetical protein